MSDTHTHIHIDIDFEREAGKQTDRHKDRLTDRQQTGGVRKWRECVGNCLFSKVLFFRHYASSIVLLQLMGSKPWPRFHH